MTWVKICGITNLEDALVAVEAGADAVGFIFYEKSPRNVAPDDVRRIISQLPADVEKVGVFASRSLDEIEDILRDTGLGSMQVYAGTHAPVASKKGDHQNPSFHGIKAYLALPLADSSAPTSGIAQWKIASRSNEVVPEANGDGPIAGVLLDSGTSWQPGGTGRTFNWENFVPLTQSVRAWSKVIVAGGLNSANVTEAMRILHPWGVDVSSGVEARPGKKDPDKVRAFVRAVRDADKLTSRN